MEGNKVKVAVFKSSNDSAIERQSMIFAVGNNIWGILSTMDNKRQQSAELLASVMPFFVPRNLDFVD